MAKGKRVVTIEETIQIVSFQVGPEKYGVSIGVVAEVIRPPAITPLPRMPEFVEGVINLRDMIIPVVDMRRRFELKEIKNNARKMRIMIMRGAIASPAGKGDRFLGLIVDGVHEVLQVPKKNIEAAPDEARGPNAEFITGMCKTDEQLVILLDTAKLLTREESAALAEAENGYA